MAKKIQSDVLMAQAQKMKEDVQFAFTAIVKKDDSVMLLPSTNIDEVDYNLESISFNKLSNALTELQYLVNFNRIVTDLSKLEDE